MFQQERPVRSDRCNAKHVDRMLKLINVETGQRASGSLFHEGTVFHLYWKKGRIFFHQMERYNSRGLCVFMEKKSCSVAESNGTLLSTGNFENCDRVSHQEHGASVLKQMVR